ncbi:MAG: hypothetical protein ACRC1J_08225, partial [Sandaracinobacteroides sp.]
VPAVAGNRIEHKPVPDQCRLNALSHILSPRKPSYIEIDRTATTTWVAERLGGPLRTKFEARCPYCVGREGKWCALSNFVRTISDPGAMS